MSLSSTHHAGVRPSTLHLTRGAWATLLDFLSQMYLVNGILTLNWKLASDAARHLILPTVVLATVPMSVIARMTRSSLLEVMNLDYMRTARAKGLNERTVVFRHAMRNALLPVVTELARWGRRFAWSPPRERERIDIGAILRAATGATPSSAASSTRAPNPLSRLRLARPRDPSRWWIRPRPARPRLAPRDSAA